MTVTVTVTVNRETSLINSKYKDDISYELPGCQPAAAAASAAPPIHINKTASIPSFLYNIYLYTPSKEVRTVVMLAARDQRTTTGRNVRLVENMSGLSVWNSTTKQMRAALRQREKVTVPVEDEWRLPYLRRLLEQHHHHHFRGETAAETEIQELIDSLCIN